VNFFLEWGATLIALVGAWLTASTKQRSRKIGFCAFLISNTLWAIWGSMSGVWGLVTMQVLFLGASIRGIISNRVEEP
jgi:hypothetical protein